MRRLSPKSRQASRPKPHNQTLKTNPAGTLLTRSRLYLFHQSHYFYRVLRIGIVSPEFLLYRFPPIVRPACQLRSNISNAFINARKGTTLTTPPSPVIISTGPSSAAGLRNRNRRHEPEVELVVLGCSKVAGDELIVCRWTLVALEKRCQLAALVFVLLPRGLQIRCIALAVRDPRRQHGKKREYYAQ